MSMSGPLSERRKGEELLRRKVLTESQLHTVIEYQNAIGGTLEEVVVKLGFASKSDLDSVLDAFLEESLLQSPATPPPAADTTGLHDSLYLNTGADETEALISLIQDPVVQAMARLLIDRGIVHPGEWRSYLSRLHEIS